MTSLMTSQYWCFWHHTQIETTPHTIPSQHMRSSKIFMKPLNTQPLDTFQSHKAVGADEPLDLKPELSNSTRHLSTTQITHETQTYKRKSLLWWNTHTPATLKSRFTQKWEFFHSCVWPSFLWGMLITKAHWMNTFLKISSVMFYWRKRSICLIEKQTAVMWSTASSFRPVGNVQENLSVCPSVSFSYSSCEEDI